MILIGDYWMGRDKTHSADLSPEIVHNAMDTVRRANLLLSAYLAQSLDDEDRRITSGWRPPSVNAATHGAAPRSKHMTGQAIDIADPDGTLDDWCFCHLDVLAECGLWMEHPSATRGWCHVQTVPPKSGNRAFYP